MVIDGNLQLVPAQVESIFGIFPPWHHVHGPRQFEVKKLVVPRWVQFIRNDLRAPQILTLPGHHRVWVALPYEIVAPQPGRLKHAQPDSAGQLALARHVKRPARSGGKRYPLLDRDKPSLGRFERVPAPPPEPRGQQHVQFDAGPDQCLYLLHLRRVVDKPGLFHPVGKFRVEGVKYPRRHCGDAGHGRGRNGREGEDEGPLHLGPLLLSVGHKFGYKPAAPASLSLLSGRRLGQFFKVQRDGDRTVVATDGNHARVDIFLLLVDPGPRTGPALITVLAIHMIHDFLSVQDRAAKKVVVSNGNLVVVVNSDLQLASPQVQPVQGVFVSVR